MYAPRSERYVGMGMDMRVCVPVSLILIYKKMQRLRSARRCGRR